MELKAKEYKHFENIKLLRADGSEYWMARELALALDYTQWRNFMKVLDKAMIACSNSGHDVVYDFAEVSKIVDAGATSKPVKDYELIANLFRISQTEEKLKRDVIKNASEANKIHHSVGSEVRAAIKRVGGTMPEDLPTPSKSISQIEKERLSELKRKAKKKMLMLDE
ncbi:MAG: hypothetical protein FWH22_05110 [Fibromonadales bacterium]|nr:hypothetical protein [Fibromonadales bacterium]